MDGDASYSVATARGAVLSLRRRLAAGYLADPQHAPSAVAIQPVFTVPGQRHAAVHAAVTGAAGAAAAVCRCVAGTAARPGLWGQQQPDVHAATGAVAYPPTAGLYRRQRAHLVAGLAAMA